jgi:glycosyltransferase involved in cell wall biosynthesis
VLEKRVHDETVCQLNPSMHWLTRIRRGLRRRYLSRTVARLSNLTAGATFFSDDRSQYAFDAIGMTAGSDVVNLHWVAGFIDYLHFFRTLSPIIPVVWTLHDMNTFTGGCHYAFDCTAFTRSCGACPQLDSNRHVDLSRRAWDRKRRAYQVGVGNRLHFVTPSKWLATEARRSSLLQTAPITSIPYSLDTEVFRPRERAIARERFGIPANAKVILFVADRASERRKGLSLLFDALRRLAHDSDLCLVMIGKHAAGFVPHISCICVEFIEDEEAMSYLYSTADVFVVPSIQDNLPNTALEALSCGVPTAAFGVGGIPEIVRDGVTGVTVPSGDSGELAKAIEELLRAPERRSEISANCRRVAVTEYSLEIQARRYVELYQALLSFRANS